MVDLMPRGAFPRRDKPVLERVWGKFLVGDECWPITCGHNGLGYGQVSVNYKKRYIHVLLYELMVGPVPEGMELDHLCKNPSCVRPDHLEPVPHKENIRRGRWGETAAARKQKTHCPHGHEYTPENTYTNRGKRYCRECGRRAQRKKS